jgi:3-hydroxymyristoyl/3-hydroxydecanoyl-(acyl carrier protein) dehydratase
MKAEAERIIPHDHPALAGHFPGNPIVPGVVILEEVLVALSEKMGNTRVVGFPSVKFLSPLPPGQPFTVQFARSDKGRVKFVCTTGGHAFARGVIEISRDEALLTPY